jgi:hypothetical protein
MLDGDILSKAAAVSSEMGPYVLIYPGSHSGRMAFRRFEHGRFAVFQMRFKGIRSVFVSYTGFLPRFAGVF